MISTGQTLVVTNGSRPFTVSAEGQYVYVHLNDSSNCTHCLTSHEANELAKILTEAAVDARNFFQEYLASRSQ